MQALFYLIPNSSSAPSATLYMNTHSKYLLLPDTLSCNKYGVIFNKMQSTPVMYILHIYVIYTVHHRSKDHMSLSDNSSIMNSTL